MVIGFGSSLWAAGTLAGCPARASGGTLVQIPGSRRIRLRLCRAGSGGGLGHGEEPNEALDRCRVALDCHIPRALSVSERLASPQHGAQCVGVGVDRRVGLISAT